MISKTIGFRGLAYFQTHPFEVNVRLVVQARESIEESEHVQTTLSKATSFSTPRTDAVNSPVGSVQI